MTVFIARDQNTYLVLKYAVQEGLEYIRFKQENNKHILSYTDFPKMGWFESGLPHVWQVPYDTPINYETAFDKEFQQRAKYWSEFIELAQSSLSLIKYYNIKDEFKTSNINHVISSIENLVNRYIHLNKTIEWDEDKFSRIYQEWENCVFSEKLYFDILVPLIYLNFDFEGVGNNYIGIQKIAEDIQLARIDDLAFTRPPHDCITGAATHALVLKNWELENSSWIYRVFTLGNRDAFSKAIEVVDQALACLRAITGIETGYNQFVIHPRGWGDNWKADLPHVSTLSIKAYPDRFDDNGWLNKPPVIKKEQAEEVLQLDEQIANNKSNKLLLACKRLNTAYLRRTEDDAILDITIGLEALLANDTKSEVVYRLALRLASLSKLEKFESYNADEIFGMCKKIYDYRSAVVHGSHDIKKKRVVKLNDDSKPIEAVNLGLSLLRYSIRVLSRNKELLNSKNIDSHIL